LIGTAALAMGIIGLGSLGADLTIGITLGGAAALRRTDTGRLTPGSAGHLMVLDAPSHHHLAYRPGVPLIRQTVY